MNGPKAKPKRTEKPLARKEVKEYHLSHTPAPSQHVMPGGTIRQVVTIQKTINQKIGNLSAVMY